MLRRPVGAGQQSLTTLPTTKLILRAPTKRQPFIQTAAQRQTPIISGIPKNVSSWNEVVGSWRNATVAVAAVALLLLHPNPVAAKQEIFGPARVVDGDTIVVKSSRIRLLGIDAPETKQSCTTGGMEYPCGLEAKSALESKISNKPVRCVTKKKDMYGRDVAVCYIDGEHGAQAVDLNAWLVAQGHAVAYRRYSTAYVPLEDAARQQRKGIWAGEFEEPQAWRKENPRVGKRNSRAPEIGAAAGVGSEAVPSRDGPLAPPEDPTATETEARDAKVVPVGAAAPISPLPVDESGGPCVIKGNVTSIGKVYHMPGGRYYDGVKIDERAGKRWFCSREAAEAAGWRPSRE